MFGDRQALIPWAPRRSDVPKKDVLINAAIATALLAWALLSPFPGFQPMTMGMLPFFFRIFAKLALLSPSPADKELARKTDFQRLLRAFGLVTCAVSLAVLVTQAIPLGCAQFFSLPVPLWFLTKRELLVNVSSAISLFIIASYYR